MEIFTKITHGVVRVSASESRTPPTIRGQRSAGPAERAPRRQPTLKDN
jgi:hypothetical protein